VSDMGTYQNKKLATILEELDLGSSVAESDTLLESARIETSAFADLLHDRVDLIPGTKGSGKSALFRIFVDFLPDFLLKSRKVVVAHGIPRRPSVSRLSRPLFRAVGGRVCQLLVYLSSISGARTVH